MQERSSARRRLDSPLAPHRHAESQPRHRGAPVCLRARVTGLGEFACPQCDRSAVRRRSSSDPRSTEPDERSQRADERAATCGARRRNEVPPQVQKWRSADRDYAASAVIRGRGPI
jgi:hypothetical protein